MIWPFKKNTQRNFKELASTGLHDLHAHILWGIDDGPKEPEGSHAMLNALSELGYVRVSCTPHCNHSMFPTPQMATITGKLSILEKERGQRSPALLPGAEIMFGENVIKEIMADSYPRLGASRTHLLEFGNQPGGVPKGTPDAIFELQVKQINIVLAHVERCTDLQRDRALLDDLITAGAIIQMDAMSLVGKYDRAPKQTAWTLLEAGIIDVVATDLHSPNDLPELEHALQILANWSEEEFIRTISTNPSLILDGDPGSVERHE